jgi:nucleoside-diphosphate-sugar epimerase
MKFRKILITGGAGYVGAVLVPRLLADDYCVTVYDLMIYGENALPKHPNLTVVKGDIRDQKLLTKAMLSQDAVIHLACISNDPSFELNPALGRSINLDAFQPLVEISREQGVKRFIYASSSSVYGIKKEMDVNEAMSLEPLTDYSRFKAECEKILLDYQSPNFSVVIVRPATVCGYSPRQRLDVIVNILTNLAYNKREISIFGGEQLRPNIHIADMVDSYFLLLQSDDLEVAGQIFNAGFENQKVKDLAEIVKEVIGQDVRMVTLPTEDNRSYHISSKKIYDELGFKATRTIRDAVIDIKNAFDQGKLPNSLNDERYFNIKQMQSFNLN